MDTFGWLDVARIGEELAEAHAGVDPLKVGFVELRRLVEALPAFKVLPGERAEPNERILEEIQRHWNEEYRDVQGDDA
jgi:FeS assembly protein IscX